MIPESDHFFLLKTTGLSAKNLDALIEEDFDLLIDSISSIDMSSLVTNMSFDLYAKISVCKITKNRKYDLKEKFYVADSISNNFNKTFNNSYYLIDQEEIDESTARFYLVLLGMFESKVKSNKLVYSIIAKETFAKNDQVELADHFFDWLSILRQLSSCWNI